MGKKKQNRMVGTSTTTSTIAQDELSTVHILQDTIKGVVQTIEGSITKKKEHNHPSNIPIQRYPYLLK